MSAAGSTGNGVPGRGTGGALPDRRFQRRGREALVRLLDAAEEVFGERGYHDATVEDFVARSGMARTTFYEYFAGKEDLFRAVLVEVTDRLRAHAAALGAITPDAAGQARLRRWLEGFIALYADHAGLLRAWTEAEVVGSVLGDLGAEALGAMVGAFTDAVRSNAAGGADAHIDADIAALAIVAMAERVNYYVAVGFLDTPPDVLADTLATVITDALGAQ